MKTIRINEDAIIFTAFEFKDLKNKAREKALQDHYEFLSLVNEDENENGEMVPTELIFDTQKEQDEYVIENIEVNEYLFDLNGDILPITHYCGKHPLSGQNSIKIFGEEKICSIS